MHSEDTIMSCHLPLMPFSSALSYIDQDETKLLLIDTLGYVSLHTLTASSGTPLQKDRSNRRSFGQLSKTLRKKNLKKKKKGSVSLGVKNA